MLCFTAHIRGEKILAYISYSVVHKSFEGLTLADIPPSKVASGNFIGRESFIDGSSLKRSEMLATGENKKSLENAVHAELHCHELGPDHTSAAAYV